MPGIEVVKHFRFTKIISLPCSVYCGRPDRVNASSGLSNTLRLA